MGDNDSFTTDTATPDLDQLLSTQSDGVTVTDSQFDNDDMLHLIKTSFGQLDRKSFKESLLDVTDIEDLRPIRNSLFDLLKIRENAYSDSKLIERAQRENGQSVGEKLTDDIFIIFQYLEGANNATELRQCISKSRRNTVASDENDYALSEIFTKLTNKTNNKKTTENSLVVSMLLDIKSLINDTMKPISDNVEKLTKHFEREILDLKHTMKEKDMTINSLKQQVIDNELKLAKLQSESKLQSQKIKEQSDELQKQTREKDYRGKIATRLDAIERKLQEKSENYKSYSDRYSEKEEVEQEQVETTNDECNTHNDYAYDTSPTQQDENYISRRMYDRTEQNRSDDYDCKGYSNYNENERYDNTYNEQNYNSDDYYYTCEDTGNHYRREKESRDYSDVFRSAKRRRTKRIVLYNISAEKSYEQVDKAVRFHVASAGATVTFTRLLKKVETRGRKSYTMRVNISESDYERLIENVNDFWPRGVYARDYVPRESRATEWNHSR